MINNSAGDAPFEVDEELFGILEDCRKYYDLTRGKFDICLGKVIEQWKVGGLDIEAHDLEVRVATGFGRRRDEEWQDEGCVDQAGCDEDQ